MHYDSLFGQHPTHLRGDAAATPSEVAEPPSSINEDTDGADDLVCLVPWCELLFTDIIIVVGERGDECEDALRDGVGVQRVTTRESQDLMRPGNCNLPPAI